jgi:hypothetical protein
LRALAAIGVALAACALIATGCGDDADTDEEQIHAVLTKLFDAQDSGDAETACDEVYVVMEPWEAEAEFGGEGEAEGEEPAGEGEEVEAEGEEGETQPGECEEVFEQARETTAAETSDLSTEIGEIEVDGDRATAVVHTELTRADGSELSQDAPYDLVHTAEGWRVRISEEG